MTRDEFIIRVGGAAGDGIASMGETLAKICSRQGLYVHSLRYYQSVIRGGLVGWNVRASNKPVKNKGDGIDILVALNSLAAETYGVELRDGGILIHDERLKFDINKLPKGVQSFALPLVATARKYDIKLKVLKNMVALGVVMRLLGLDFKLLEERIHETFSSKGKDVVDMNLSVAKEGYELGAQLPQCPHNVKFGENPPKMLISGNEAAALGGMAGGLKFYVAYPMTPATSILHFLAAHAAKYNLVVKQMEDELAVINAAIGASFAGVRSMCATSGGGFSLMTEAIGLAGMAEIPVVAINSMRGGPSTGMPTQTEQGDLNQLFGASQGDYPRAIIAPLDVKDTYESVIEALNLAEKYQIPVLIGMDLYLSEHWETVEELNLEPEIYEREQPQLEPDGRYLRYKFTETGVSPRSIPGEPNFAHVAASDEHDEDSSLISDVRAGLLDAIEIRRKMVEKRGRKIEYLKKELRPPVTYGPDDAEITIVGWGSSTGAIQEAVDILNREGIKANSLHIRYIFPFQSEKISKILNNAKTLLMVEGNYSGQMRRHIRAETGIWIEHALLKYDGTYWSPKEIVQKAKEVLNK